MNWKTYIHSDSKILLGKPVVRGTRLSVEFILGLFSQGWAQQQVLESYPTLSAFRNSSRVRICGGLSQSQEFKVRSSYGITHPTNN